MTLVLPPLTNISSCCCKAEKDAGVKFSIALGNYGATTDSGNVEI